MLSRLKKLASIDLRSNYFSPLALVFYLAVLATIGVLLTKWGGIGWLSFDPSAVGTVGEWIGGLAAGAGLLALGHQLAIEREDKRAAELDEFIESLQEHIEAEPTRQWCVAAMTWCFRFQEQVDRQAFPELRYAIEQLVHLLRLHVSDINDAGASQRSEAIKTLMVLIRSRHPATKQVVNGFVNAYHDSLEDEDGEA